VLEHEPEVAAAPGDRLIRTNDAMRDAGDGSLAGASSARHVEVDAQRQEKAALRWRCDLCFELDELHRLS
jgi:hypothetical protein